MEQTMPRLMRRPAACRLTFTPLPPAPCARADPWRSPRDTPANQAAARVLRRVMGAEPLFFK
jgi:hypothetical protein